MYVTVMNYEKQIQIRLNLKPTTTILNVKTILTHCERIDFTNEGIHLHYNNNFGDLRDNHCLNDLDIHDTEEIMLLLNPIMVHVRKRRAQYNGGSDGNDGSAIKATFSLYMSLSSTIADLQREIQLKEGIAPDDQRIYFAGNRIYREYLTLEECNIENGSIIDVRPPLRGNISSFSSSNNKSLGDPLEEFLMLTDEERSEMSTTMTPSQSKRLLDALVIKAKEEKAILGNPNIKYTYDESRSYLHPLQCDVLSSFLNHVWDTKLQDNENVVDIRMLLTDDQFLSLLESTTYEDKGVLLGEEYTPKTILNELKLKHQSISSTHLGANNDDDCHIINAASSSSSSNQEKGKLALRMTRGPTNSCINFHCDISGGSGTCQIPLNDPSEYQGGKLCFFSISNANAAEASEGRSYNNFLKFVPRTKGSLTMHPSKILHGVTTVTSGTRKSLFGIDKYSGLGVDDDESGSIVIELTDNDIESFLSTQNKE